jgi:hypothetical protein
MSDGALTLLLLAAMLAGPAGAFMVGPALLAAYVLFPVAGAVSLGPRWLLRAAVLQIPAAASLALGLLTGSGGLALRSLRWAAAIPCGLVMAGWLGTRRMERVLVGASTRMGRAGGALEVLALLLASAGPSARSVRMAFRRLRRRGMGVAESAESALGELVLVRPGGGSPTPPGAWAAPVAAAGWMLFLAGLGGL